MKGLKALENIKKFYNSEEIKGFVYRDISDYIFNRAEYIISHLDIEPEVFPTFCGHIQLEYEYDDYYLEILIVERNRLNIFIQIKDREYDYRFPKNYPNTRIDDVKFLNMYIDMFLNRIDKFERLTRFYLEV